MLARNVLVAKMSTHGCGSMGLYCTVPIMVTGHCACTSACMHVGCSGDLFCSMVERDRHLLRTVQYRCTYLISRACVRVVVSWFCNVLSCRACRANAEMGNLAVSESLSGKRRARRMRVCLSCQTGIVNAGQRSAAQRSVSFGLGLGFGRSRGGSQLDWT